MLRVDVLDNDFEVANKAFQQYFVSWHSNYIEVCMLLKYSGSPPHLGTIKRCLLWLRHLIVR